MSKPPQSTDEQKKKALNKDRALLRETLVMPLRVYFVASVREPSGQFEHTPCVLWKKTDVTKIVDIARALMTRLFGIQIEPAYERLDVRTLEEVYYKEGGGYAQEHARMAHIVGRSKFADDETHALFLGRIYKDDRQNPSAKAYSLHFTDRKRAWELGSNKLIIDYAHGGAEIKGKERNTLCTVTRGKVPPHSLLGPTLAHELGHSLHLRHLQDEPLANLEQGSARNLMDRDVDGPTGKVAPKSAYSILPVQRARARAFGRCFGRFRGAKTPESTDCRELREDLGLTEEH